ncbi:MAG: hypothetical protein VX278_18225, partial [Myxococcota bacterium]|nr:hypothetical protein [Myxococcota bacterium]
RGVGGSGDKMKFRARCFSVDKIQESLSGEIHSWPLLGLTLRERQKRALLWAGGDFANEGESASLWIREDVFVTEDAIKLFISSIKDKEGVFYWNPIGELGVLQERLMFGKIEPLMVWSSKGIDDDILANAQPLDVSPSFQPFSMEVSKEHFGVDILTFPITDAIVLPTLHWLQLLWANFIGMGPFLWRELVGRNPGWAVWRLTVAFFRVWSVKPHVLLGGFRRYGKGCKIHPSAIVEASWLGNNVQIGANAVVRGCVIGDDVRIEDLAMVEYSILDVGVCVQRQAMVKFSLLRYRSAVGGVIQLGVMDSASAIKRGAYLLDMNFGEKGAKILWNGEPKEPPLGYAGCCIGENSKIGLGVRIAPGRTIPPNIEIAASPDQFLLRIPEGLEGLVHVDKGSLRQND